MDQKYDVSSVLYLKKKKMVAKRLLFPCQKESSRCPKDSYFSNARGFCVRTTWISFKFWIVPNSSSFLHASNVKMVYGYKIDCI